MDADALIAERLRSHRLTAPAPTLADAARHMLAVQAQEFWGGRWALAARTRGEPTIGDVDALFDDGTLVRTTTMRGTLHIVPADDVAAILAVTGERQSRQAASRQRQLGLDAPALARAEGAVTKALRGGGRLTRAEIFVVLDRIGVDPAGQRGAHVLYDLAARRMLVQGPVVRRDGAVAREQYFVLADEWLPSPRVPDDPVAALFVRYIAGHGPASAADFAWWSGLPATVARGAADASAAQLTEVAEGVYVSSPRPRRRTPEPRVLALPSFEEYYISYVDRSVVADAAMRDAAGPGRNGMVRPIIVADGRLVGTWTQSTAVGRHAEDPVPALVDEGAATDAEVVAALARYAGFVTG